MLGQSHEHGDSGLPNKGICHLHNFLLVPRPEPGNEKKIADLSMGPSTQI